MKDYEEALWAMLFDDILELRLLEDSTCGEISKYSLMYASLKQGMLHITTELEHIRRRDP